MEKICCFTGHRKLEKFEEEAANNILDKLINTLIAKGYTTFRTGGALGFDTIAANAVLKKKENNSELRLELILPCKSQSGKWSVENKAEYARIVSLADSVEYVSDEYTHACMWDRNRRLVNNSDICIAFCTRSSGGTYGTCMYAISKDTPVVNIAKIMLSI